MHRHNRPLAIQRCPPSRLITPREAQQSRSKGQRRTPQLGGAPGPAASSRRAPGAAAAPAAPSRPRGRRRAALRPGSGKFSTAQALRAEPARPPAPRNRRRRGTGGRTSAAATRTPANPLPRPAPALARPLPLPRGGRSPGRYKPLFPTAMAGLPPPELPPPGPSWRGPSGGDSDRSRWEPPPGLAVLGRALFRGGSRPQPALILGGPASARPARLSRAGPPAAAGARRQPPPGDGATMRRRRRLCPSASSGPAAPGSSRRPRPRREGAEGAVGPGPSRVQRGGPGAAAAAATAAARSKMAPRPPHPLSPWRPAPPPPAAGARAGKQRGARRALRRRAAVVAAAAGAGPGGAMEGGGNSKGTGLGGLFGAGGVGYSHADLAGVPREYRRGRGAAGEAVRRRPPSARAAGGRRYPLPVSGAGPGRAADRSIDPCGPRGRRHHRSRKSAWRGRGRGPGRRSAAREGPRARPGNGPGPREAEAQRFLWPALAGGGIGPGRAGPGGWARGSVPAACLHGGTSAASAHRAWPLLTYRVWNCYRGNWC